MDDNTELPAGAYRSRKPPRSRRAPTATLHRGMVITPWTFRGSCRVQTGGRCRFQPSENTQFGGQTPPQHSCPADQLAIWECIADRLRWEVVMRITHGIETGSLGTVVTPETVDYNGFAESFVRHVVEVAVEEDGIAIEDQMPAGANLWLPNPQAYYGDDIGGFLRKATEQMVWWDDTPRFSDVVLPTGTTDGDILDTVRVMVPRLSAQERQRLRHVIRKWNGLGKLRDDILTIV